MRTLQKTVLTLSALAILLSGCIPSLHPIYEQGKTVTKQGLISRWESVDKTQSWRFEAGSGDSYQLEIVDDKQRRSTFIVHLTEIGDDLFMDLFPSGNEQQADFYKLHMVKTHTFYRIKLDEQTLTISFLQPVWLRQHMSDHPDAIDIQPRGEHSALITANTEALRKFVQQHANTPSAFSNPYELKRVLVE